MNEKISPLALKCLKQLNDAGYRAYLVGGSVRDLLRGIIPHDYDLCTSALPQETQTVFAADKTVLTGVQHGTVTVIKSGESFEITTFRRESGYSDSRHPDHVFFTSDLYQDLSRRDFTMNAIAYHPIEGLIDPFDGETAIRKKQISCVGNPLVRFDEDALRMLRAIRFEACLEFTIDAPTLAAISSKAFKISDVSRERIKEELTKILLSDNAFEGGNRLLSLLGTFLFGHETAFLNSSVINQTSTHESVRYAAFLLNAKHPAALLHALHCPNELIHSVSAILKAQTASYPLSLIGARMLCRDLEKNALPAAELIDLRARKSDRVMSKFVSMVIEHKDPVTLSVLAINGADLIDAGIPSGKEIGKVLSHLLDLVIQDPSKNQKSVLLKEAIKFRAPS